MKVLSFLLICISFSAYAGNASSNTLLLKANKLNSVLADQQQQSVKLTGTISDEQGSGIPGATIRVKGSRIAATTNATGVFTITVPNEASVLQFTYVGYVTQEIVVGKQQNIKIYLMYMVDILI